MSFLDQIEKVQKKPDHVRKKIVNVATALFTGLIVLVWLTVANPLSLSSGNNPVDTENDPFSMIKDIKDTASVAGTAINDFKEGLDEVKNYTEAIKYQAEKQAETATTTEENLDLNN